jgi:hypothetical protein
MHPARVTGLVYAMQGGTMALGITNAQNVALFDTSSGWAFGPVFDSKEDAEDFIRYAREVNDVDPRQVATYELAVIHAAWVMHRQCRASLGLA